jgi:hypothetical protein
VKEFKDAKGETWQIVLHFGNIARTMRASDKRFNLTQVGELADQLAQDPLEFYDLLWILLKPQADAKNIDEEQFGERMAAYPIHEARLAFFAEWEDFFRQAQRPDQMESLGFTVGTLKKSMELMQAQIEKDKPLFAQASALAESLMKEHFETSFSSLRESVASHTTPGATHGETSSDSAKDGTAPPAN